MSEPPSTSPDKSDPAHQHRAESGTTDAREKGEGNDEVLHAIMFTDIQNSVSLTGMLGKKKYAELLTRHGQLFYEALDRIPVVNIEKTGDGFMARFTQAAQAVEVALRFQWLLRREVWNIGQPLRVRIGINQGEILLIPGVQGAPAMVGTAVSLAARVMGLADGGQILLTRPVFDATRESIAAIPEVSAEEQTPLRWEAHGAYLVKGIEGEVEVHEVGEQGCAPFRRPPNGPNAERALSADEEKALRWRPEVGVDVPNRPAWRLVRQLGQGGFGEVWLAAQRTTGEERVFKFCFDVVRLRTLQQELMLVEHIHAALGPRPDIAQLYDVQRETSPYFLESAYYAGGTLEEWLRRKSEAGGVSRAQRLAVVTGVARALAAAHSVGIIHKDVKPSNILIEELPDGSVRPRLADFGIGELTLLASTEGPAQSDAAMWTQPTSDTHSAPPMYRAPEYLKGDSPSILGDVYSLGVVLYQIVIGDFREPIGPNLERDVKDSLLVEDIAACVDTDPARRLSSASLVAERLETLEERRSELAARELAERKQQELEEKLKAQKWKMRLAGIITAVATVLVAALTVTAVVLQHSKSAAIQHSKEIAHERETERDQLYRENMISGMANLQKWRGGASREAVDQYAHPAPGERDRRGWEWRFLNAALNPPHLIRQVSAKPLRALAVSPDEDMLAVAGDDGEISIWSCETLEKIDSWKTDAVRSLTWKGELLAIGLETGEVVLRDVSAKHDRKRWKAHDGAVATLAWNPARDELTTGGADGYLKRWQDDGTPLAETHDSPASVPMDGRVLALDWNAKGHELAVVLGDPTRLRVGTPGHFGHGYEMYTPESAVAWRPGSFEVAISIKDMPMSSLNPTDGRDYDFHLKDPFSPGASAFAWAPDGQRVAVGGVDGKIMIVSKKLPSEQCPVLYGHSQRINALRWLKRDRLLSVGEDGTLRAWDDLQRPPHVLTTEFPAPLADAQWSPKDGRLAVLIAGEQAEVLDAAGQVQWSRPMPVPSETYLVYRGARLAWSPDGRRLAAACAGRGVVAWRLGGDERFISAHLNKATEVHWLDDNQTLLVRDDHGWWQVDIATDTVTQVADAQTVWVGNLDGGRIGRVSNASGFAHFTATAPAGVAPLDIPLPKELGAIHLSTLSPDRTRLAVAGESGAFLWIDTHTGLLTRPEISHSSAVQAIAWHPDGTRLVTASSDGTCRVFDPAQGVETWMIEHSYHGIVAAAWSFDGVRLLLASSQGRALQVYDASPSAARIPAARAASILADIEDHPDQESGWRALLNELQANEDKMPRYPALLVAAKLGRQARFAPLPESTPAGLVPITEWEGVALPPTVRIAQACALGNWDEVLTLSSGTTNTATASWFAMARAEALAQLGRQKESEAANLEAWQALRHLQFAPIPAKLPIVPTGGPSYIDLTPWATAHPLDDWAVEDRFGSENNNFPEFPKILDAQPDGVVFHCGDFILLAGRSFRSTGERMLPRSTPWIPLNSVSRQIACLLASCNVPDDDDTDTCIGSIFLLHSDGGAVRIPLVYGRNIWRWWRGQSPRSTDAPDWAIAWTGGNGHATTFGFDLALYRLNWTAETGESPVVAISIVSAMRQPAPLLMSVDARP